MVGKVSNAFPRSKLNLGLYFYIEACGLVNNQLGNYQLCSYKTYRQPLSGYTQFRLSGLASRKVYFAL